MSHDLYIIAGPNGSGKTTFAREFLAQYADCATFINADSIAANLVERFTGNPALRAGRQMLTEIERNAAHGYDFGFETTLSGRSYLPLIRRLKESGYRIHFFFLFLPAVELSLDRIRGRVAEGGHDIPEPIVRRRFDRSIRNFLKRYRQLANSWILFDNSAATPRVIAFQNEHGLRIIEKQLYETIARTYESSD
jgi:predicted ABC-type ATPase